MFKFISSMSNSKILTDERAFFGSYNEFLGFISMFSVLTPLPTGPISHFGVRLPLFQNESWCETSHFLARSSLHERLSSSTRFKIKVTACISVTGKPRKIWRNSLNFSVFLNPIISSHFSPQKTEICQSFLHLKVIRSVKNTLAMHKPPEFLRSRIIEDRKYAIANKLFTERTKLMGLLRKTNISNNALKIFF